MERSCFSPLRFDSGDLPVADQYRTFASAMVNFDMARDSTGPYAARALIWRIGALVVTQVTAEPVKYDRPLSRVRADKVDHIYLNYHFRGAVTPRRTVPKSSLSSARSTASAIGPT